MEVGETVKKSREVKFALLERGRWLNREGAHGRFLGVLVVFPDLVEVTQGPLNCSFV